MDVSEKIYAGIDIGTNTILMTVGKGSNVNDLTYLEDCHAIAHLGEGVNSTGIINPYAIQRAKDILTEYKKITDKLGVTKINMMATSAMRDAKNSYEVAKVFEQIIGFPVQIITGNEEARLSFLGTVEDDDKSDVIDIGGGSVEIISGKINNFEFQYSYQMGAVRLTEMFFETLPPKKEEIIKFENFVENRFIKHNLPKFSDKTYAVAGTPTSLAMIYQGLKEFNKEKIHGFLLNYETVDYCVNELIKKDLKSIIIDYNIPAKRANILTAGCLILKSIMKIGNINSIIVNAHGLRYGILKDMYL